MKILLNLLSIINIIIFIKKSTSTHSASSINTTNICIRNQNECKGIYDQFNLSYRVHCEKKACDNHFNFACNSFYCTRDKETCRKNHLDYVLPLHSCLFMLLRASSLFLLCFIQLSCPGQS